MPVAYPAGLPTVLASKRTARAPGFSLSPASRGAVYAELTGTDAPTFFDVEWLLQDADAVTLHTWVFTTLRSGALQFVMPLRTEDGLRNVTGNFMPEGLLDRQRVGTLWRYQAAIVARDGLGVAA